MSIWIWNEDFVGFKSFCGFGIRDGFRDIFINFMVRKC